MTPNPTGTPKTPRAMWFQLVTLTEYPPSLPHPLTVQLTPIGQVIGLGFATAADAERWAAHLQCEASRRMSQSTVDWYLARAASSDGWAWMLSAPTPPTIEQVVAAILTPDAVNA